MARFLQDHEFIKKVFECSPLPMVVMDADTRLFADCNPAAAKMYGYASTAEVIGKGPLDFSPSVQPDGTVSLEKDSDYIEQAIRDGSMVFEWRHVRPNGELWDAEVHLHCFETSSNLLLHLSLFDITERKRTLQLQRLVHDLVLELNSCSDLYDGFSKVLGAMMRIEPFDCGGIYIVDPATGSLRLVAHHGLLAKYIEKVSYHEADSPNVRIAREGTPQYGTFQEIRPTTDSVCENEKLRAFAMIPIMAEGELIALLNLASHLDDTVLPSSRTALETIAFQIGGSLLRFRSQVAMRESEAILASFIQHSPVLTYIKEVTSTDSIVLQASDSFVELIGQGGKEIVGKSMNALFPPQFAQKIIADDQAVIASLIPVRLEEEFNRKFFHTIKFPVKQGNRTLLCGYTIDVTERKQIELTLRESEEKYRTLYTTMSQGVVHQNAKGQIIGANPAAERILGLTLDQMKGRRSMDKEWKAVKEDGSDFQGEEHPISVALRTGKEVRNVVHGVYNPIKDSLIWISVNAIPLFLPGESTPWQAYATIEDITERVVAQKALLRTQILLNESIQQSPVPIALASAQDCKFKIINRAAADFLLVNADDYLEKTLNEIDICWQEYARDGRKITAAELPLPRALQGFSTNNMEMMIERRDGSQVWELASGAPIYDSNGTLIAALLVMQDITENKRVEEKVLANERRFRELIRNSSDSVTVLDREGLQVFVSDAVERMLGYKPDELLNIPVIETMLHPEDRQGVADAFQRIIRDGKGQVQYRHRRKDGSWAYLEAWGTNQLDNPDIRGVVVNVRDISERKRTEETLQNVQKLEALGVLAGGIAHDFNNLMGGLFGYLDLAQSHCDNAQALEYLDKATTAIDRARGLTHQLLTFSKGGVPIQKTGPLFPFVQETAQFALSGSTVSCRFDLPSDLFNCNFGKNQIGQVIDNLIINAQQAMPLGGTIEVSARNISVADKEHPLLPMGDYVKLSVQDYGIGIPKDLLSKIFDPFFTTKPRGLGLGLATGYSIMRRHGGCIEVESEQGRGSVFHLFLPAARESDVKQEHMSTSMHKGRGTILVMDDEETIRDTLAAMLELLGYEVVSLDNGQAAVNFFKEENAAFRTLQALFFDLTIPGGMGGSEAIAEIRKLDGRIPAFVVSGYADDPVVRNPVVYGFTASLCKPFRKAELIELLKNHLTVKR